MLVSLYKDFCILPLDKWIHYVLDAVPDVCRDFRREEEMVTQLHVFMLHVFKNSGLAYGEELKYLPHQFMNSQYWEGKMGGGGGMGSTVGPPLWNSPLKNNFPLICPILKEAMGRTSSIFSRVDHCSWIQEWGRNSQRGPTGKWMGSNVFHLPLTNKAVGIVTPNVSWSAYKEAWDEMLFHIYDCVMTKTHDWTNDFHETCLNHLSKILHTGVLGLSRMPYCLAGP